MATLTYETTEYRAPEQAALYDVFIPTGGFATDIGLDADAFGSELPGGQTSYYGVIAAFDTANEVMIFRPTGMPSLETNDEVTVTISWKVGDQVSSAEIVVHGQAGNEDAPAIPYLGTEGADVIASTRTLPHDGSDDIIDGLGGDDVILSGYGYDIVHGGEGNDYIDDDGDTFALGGSTFGSAIYGDGGDDTLIGGDLLDGGDGDDTLYGISDVRNFSGATMHGGGGDDWLHTSSSPDLVDGGAGFDTVDYGVPATGGGSGIVAVFALVDGHGIGGRFAGTLPGGYTFPQDDPDVLTVFPTTSSSGDTYTSIEQIVGSAYDDLVYGAVAGTVGLLGAGNDVFDNRHESQARDKVFGEAGDDRIWTGGGHDSLFGGAGNDELWGEHGNDLIAGGAGNDVLIGGWGRDVYRFGATGADGNDTILGFEDDWDKLDVADDIPLAQILYGQSLLENGDLVVRYAGLAFDAFVTIEGLGTTLTATDFI